MFSSVRRLLLQTAIMGTATFHSAQQIRVVEQPAAGKRKGNYVEFDGAGVKTAGARRGGNAAGGQGNTTREG